MYFCSQTHLHKVIKDNVSIKYSKIVLVSTQEYNYKVDNLCYLPL